MSVGPARCAVRDGGEEMVPTAHTEALRSLAERDGTFRITDEYRYANRDVTRATRGAGHRFAPGAGVAAVAEKTPASDAQQKHHSAEPVASKA